MKARPQIVWCCVLLLAAVILMVVKFSKTTEPVFISEKIPSETQILVARNRPVPNEKHDNSPLSFTTSSDLSGPTKEELQQLLSMEPTEESLRKLSELIDAIVQRTHWKITKISFRSGVDNANLPCELFAIQVRKKTTKRIKLFVSNLQRSLYKILYQPLK